MRKELKYIIISVASLVAGCVSETKESSMPNDIVSNVPALVEIAENDRERFAINKSSLSRVARTECTSGYALELYAPSQVSYGAAIRDTTRTSSNAMFWVMRVPQNPPQETYEMTIPNALDKPEWFAERFVDGRWEMVQKPPSLGSAHESVTDTPAIFNQSDIQGDNILPVDLRRYLPKVLESPGNGRYRIHFAPFTANIGQTKCSLDARFWEVDLI